MLLTQLTTIKTRLGISDTTDDTLLTNLTEFASARFERDTNRSLDRVANATEEFPADQTEILVGRLPLEAVTSFHLKQNETDGWLLQSNIDYLIRRACVISLSAPIGTKYEQARVTYTGGYVLPGTSPGAGQTALPDDLEHACTEQIAHWYQNRFRLGLLSMPAEGRTFFNIAQIDLLPQVQSVLKLYERYSL